MFAAKLEATPGSAESLAAADGAENFFMPEMNPTIEMHERETQGTFSPISQIPGSAMGAGSISTHVYNSGSGTAPLWVSTMLRTAGFAQQGTTSTYAPSIAVTSTSNTNTGTFAHYVDGNCYKVSGAMCDLEMTAEKVGAPIVCKWSFQGVWYAPTATGILTPTYPTVTPPAFKAATLSLATISPFVVSKFSLKLNNRVTLREDASQTYGIATYAMITDRKPVLSLTVEVPAVGSYEYYANQLSAAQGAFSLAIGSGSNNVVTIAAPKAQLIGTPRLVDLKGVLGYELEYQLNRSAAIGDDELTIALS